MKKAKLNILGVCETRRAGNRNFVSEEFRIIHSAVNEEEEMELQ